MVAPDGALERKVLLGSIASAAALGVLGVVWGIASRSQMILLDGVSAVIGIILWWLLLRASMLAGRQPTRHHHDGFESATPLAIGVQGFVLLGTLVYAAAESGFTIRDGGSDLAAGWALVYSVIVTAGCLVTWVWLRRRTSSSDVLMAPSVTVAEQHQVREALHERLDALPYEVWLTVELAPRPAVRP